MYEVISCHQPNFLPYLGFFEKMEKSDLFVIRDEVLFTDSDFHHRNKIRINSNNNFQNPMLKWIGVPVDKLKDYIKNIPIKNTSMIKKRPWNEWILHEISVNYNSTRFFKDFFPELEKIFDNSDTKLINLNMKLINFLKESFGISTKIIMASDLKLRPEKYSDSLNSDPSEDLINICKKLGAESYLSGTGAKSYLNLNTFEKEGIGVRFQEYRHPIYQQSFPGFITHLSAIDALFCTGKFPKSEPLAEIKIWN